MADPIIEKVALTVKSAIEAVTVANGYQTGIVEVVRENNADDGYNPRHLSCLLMQEFGQDLVIEQGNPVLVTYPVTFSALVFVSPSKDDTTPIDRYINIAMADVYKGVTEDWNDKTADTIGGLVFEWSVLPPVKFSRTSGDSFDGVACNFLAKIRVNENDPYTQR